MHISVPPALFNVPLTGTRQLGAAIVLGVAALLAFAAAAGMIWHDALDEEEDEELDEDEDEDESAWVSLGLVAHYLLSFQARLARMFRRSATSQFPAGERELSRRRLEPRARDEAEQDEDDEDKDPNEARMEVLKNIEYVLLRA